MAAGDSHSRYAHMCASCASLIDGQEESSPVPVDDSAAEQKSVDAEEHSHKA
jgi:hypothetical protein